MDLTTTRDAFQKLERYIQQRDYSGYDCYDALNSPFLSFITKPHKYLRIAAIQFIKKCPINLRPVLFVKPGHNPKGLGLFLSATAMAYRATDDKNYLKSLEHLTTLLRQNESQGYSGSCWGYNFDWQSRVFFVPKYTPTIVNTSFVAQAFIDAFIATGREEFLVKARSACDFIMRDLYHTREGDRLSFSYTPIDRLKVHNANILGAGLLARVYAHTKEKELYDYAKASAEYVLHYQRPDGSWYYAEEAIQHWTDSFHTGFVLDSLDWYVRGTGDQTPVNAIKTGFRYYIENFFLEDGSPKYYHDRIYPIDAHSPAQAFVTLTRLGGLDQRASNIRDHVRDWTLLHMRSPKGFFYFQKHPNYINKIPYMRWVQAWSYYGLAHLLFYDTFKEIHGYSRY